MRRWALAAFVALSVAAAALAPPARAVETVPMPFAAAIAPVADGTIGAGEYPSTFADPKTGMVVHAVHDGTVMAVGLESPGTGWLAIGFGPEGVIMDGANILMGFVTASGPTFTDQHGVGYEHLPDTASGGTDDLIAFAGSEGGGRTYIEFRYPLDTGQSLDYALRPGRTFGLTLAYHATADDFETMHTLGSVLNVDVGSDPNALPTRRATFSFDVDGAPVEGSPVNLTASLLGDDGIPLAGAEIEFYLNASVGLGRIAAATTDPSGVATRNFTFLSAGEFRFVARFAGNQEYLPAEANATAVAALRTEGPAGLDAGVVIPSIILMVLAGVGLAYAYAAAQIVHIRSAGRGVERTAAASAGQGAPRSRGARRGRN